MPKVLAAAVLHSSWKNKRLAIEQAELSSEHHTRGAEVWRQWGRGCLTWRLGAVQKEEGNGWV